MTTVSTESKIVIAAGTPFTVPASLDNEAIRQQLVSMGFADVATATIQTGGTREIDGVTYPTVEFVKKAGTKGLDGSALAALLAHLPPTSIASGPRIAPESRQALRRLADGGYTVAEALADDRLLAGALDDAEAANEPTRPSQEGVLLCERIDGLPAVAAPSAPCGW